MGEALALFVILVLAAIVGVCVAQIRELIERAEIIEKNMLLMRDVVNQNMFAIQNQLNRLHEQAEEVHPVLH